MAVSFERQSTRVRNRSEFFGRRHFLQYISVGTFARSPCEYFMNIFALRLIREQNYSYLAAGSPAVYVYILLCIRLCMCVLMHNTYLPETPMRVVERVGKKTHSAKVSLSHFHGHRFALYTTRVIAKCHPMTTTSNGRTDFVRGRMYYKGGQTSFCQLGCTNISILFLWLSKNKNFIFSVFIIIVWMGGPKSLIGSYRKRWRPFSQQ